MKPEVFHPKPQELSDDPDINYEEPLPEYQTQTELVNPIVHEAYKNKKYMTSDNREKMTLAELANRENVNSGHNSSMNSSWMDILSMGTEKRINMQ